MLMQVDGGSAANAFKIEESMAAQQQLEHDLKTCQAECTALGLKLAAAEEGLQDANAACSELREKVGGSFLTSCTALDDAAKHARYWCSWATGWAGHCTSLCRITVKLHLQAGADEAHRSELEDEARTLNMEVTELHKQQLHIPELEAALTLAEQAAHHAEDQVSFVPDQDTAYDASQYGCRSLPGSGCPGKLAQ